jgi:hypothetical protein
MDGLIVNWLLNPAEFSLVKEGQLMLDAYLRGLGAEIPEAVKIVRTSKAASKTAVTKEKSPSAPRQLRRAA